MSFESKGLKRHWIFYLNLLKFSFKFWFSSYSKHNLPSFSNSLSKLRLLLVIANYILFLLLTRFNTSSLVQFISLFGIHAIMNYVILVSLSCKGFYILIFFNIKIIVIIMKSYYFYIKIIIGNEWQVLDNKVWQFFFNFMKFILL